MQKIEVEKCITSSIFTYLPPDACKAMDLTTKPNNFNQIIANKIKYGKPNDQLDNSTFTLYRKRDSGISSASESALEDSRFYYSSFTAEGKKMMNL